MKNYYNSPIGWLELTASKNTLNGVKFLESKPGQDPVQTNGILKQTITELSEYFDGARTGFSIPLELKGTEFQKTVWRELQHIPYGKTITYGELAEKLGDPKKVRAVGRANGQNPLPVIIPCHRVVGAGNSLVGYGGGISRKKFLLKHEGAILL